MKQQVPPDSVQLGNNPVAVAQLANFYIKDGMRVADVTFGKGIFWRKTNIFRFKLYPTDLIPVAPARKADLRRMPYSDASMHVVVLDPPYQANPTPRHVLRQGSHNQLEDRYRNYETTAGMNHDDILELYAEGMQEAKRVLRPNGMLWIKCKDATDKGKQRWISDEIRHIAEGLGFYAKDRCIIVPTSRSYNLQFVKHHLCKVHSYMWIFERRRGSR